MTTKGDVLRRLAERHLAPDDPERVYLEWLTAHTHRLRAACLDLGVEPPADGPRFGTRLKAAVLPVLLEHQKGQP